MIAVRRDRRRTRPPSQATGTLVPVLLFFGRAREIPTMFGFASPLFRAVLWCAGWAPIDDDARVAGAVVDHDVVYVYPHTSGWDLAIIAAYRLAYPDVFSNVTFLTKPQLRLHLLSRSFVSCVRLEDRGGGFVDELCATLRERRPFQLAISPTGCREPRPWRSGYRRIAERFPGTRIFVFGLDYELKALRCVTPRHDVDDPIEERALKEAFGEIVPLHPGRSTVPLRSHDPDAVSVVDWVLASNVAGALVAIPFCAVVSPELALTCAWCMCVSMSYHRCDEGDLRLQLLDNASTALFVSDLLFHASNMRFRACARDVGAIALFAALAGAAAWCYSRGHGRVPGTPRSATYRRCHSWFHALSCAAVVLPASLKWLLTP